MRRFGLIGYPLSHSFSRKYFKEKFKKENITDASYQIFPIQSLVEFPNIIHQMPELVGLNVTIPYKVDIIPFLNEIDLAAKDAGAVNTIKIIKLREPGQIEVNEWTDQNLSLDHVKLIGYNTDVYGFEMTLKPLLQPIHTKALILGTGGASKAVEYIFKKLGISYLFVSRNPEKSNEVSYGELNETAISQFPLIVNTTPLGMFPDTDKFPPIPYEFLTENHFLYDLIYNPEETIFLKKGREKGAITQNGLSMLKFQAEKAWEIWNS